MHLIRTTVGLLTLVSFTSLNAFAQCPEEDCINRRDPGSLLLFPEYQNGPGRVTVVTVTNTNCTADGDVLVEFKYLNGENCAEANQQEDLTPCDTFTTLTSEQSGIGSGYMIAFAKIPANSQANLAGNPIVFNHLIGSQLVVNGWLSIDYSVNAVSFGGIGEDGDLTDRESPGLFGDADGDGVKDLDGVEYERAPDRILIPRFLGQDDVLAQRGLHSDLILINLSGGRAFRESPANLGGGTTVLIHGWNDNEQMFSLEHTFSCWQKIRLGLLQSSDLETPVPGTFSFNNDTLDNFGNDPNEIAGANGLESGWFWIDGLFANSTTESIMDPAIYAVLVENVRSRSAADLPFELCAQDNGDIIPNNGNGDFNGALTPPGFSNSDNQ